MNDDWNLVFESALEVDASRDFSRAEQLYSRVLELNPSSRNAYLYRVLAIAKQGRREEAIPILAHFVTRVPNSSVALNWLCKLLRETGRYTVAIPYGEKAASLSPTDPDILYNLGLAYFAEERFQDAIERLKLAVDLLPQFAPAFYALACVYESMGQPWQAIVSATKNVELDPAPEGFLKLGQLCLAVGDLKKAIDNGEKAKGRVEIEAQVHLLLAEAYGDVDPALHEVHLNSACEIDRSLRSVYRNTRSKRLSRLGRIDEAIEIYRQDLEESPDSAAGLLNLVTLKRIGQDDLDLIEKLQSVAQSPELSPQDRVHLHFALGKSFDNLGDYETAFRHFTDANQILVKTRPSLNSFDRKAFSRRVDSLIGTFSKEFIAAHALSDRGEDRPIFVVGMMRSGTTLLDQVLSRHTEIESAGELAHWTYGDRQIVISGGRKIDLQKLADTRNSYLEILAAVDPVSHYVTDKNPANCFVLGLIAMAFPSSHIVYMVRDPADTAVSIFTTPMRTPPEFGGNLSNIGFAIRQTDRLRSHWRQVLPPERLHMVRYEDLILDQEQTTRKLISDLGLDWQEACLHPEESKSLVGTPSLWQVRQPINPGSIGRSERYKPWVGTFA